MYYTRKYLLPKDTMNTAQSRNSDPTSLTTRSGRVTATAHSGYTTLMRSLGLALVTTAAVVALAANAQPTTSVQSAEIAVPAPHWNPAVARQFPHCVGTGSFLPGRIVVVSHDDPARTMPYNAATITQIKATWANDDAWDDLYTIGKCAR